MDSLSHVKSVEARELNTLYSSSDSHNASASRVVNHLRKNSLVLVKYYLQAARVLVTLVGRRMELSYAEDF